MSLYAIGTFEHTAYLELLLKEVEQRGVPIQQILVIPLEPNLKQRKLADTIHRSDGLSLFDGGAVLATAFSVLGASVGFRLPGGPIIWGLLGVVIGFVIGFILDLLMNTKRFSKKTCNSVVGEVVVIVECWEKQFAEIERLFKDHMAIATQKFDPSERKEKRK